MLTVIAAAALLCASPVPEGVSVSRWVREDIFAGILAGDMAQFAQGMEKVEAILADNPKSGEAQAWRGGGRMLLAVRALEAGDSTAFQARYAEAVADFDAARTTKSEGVMVTALAVEGAAYVLFSDRLPADMRRAGWESAKERYSRLLALQKAYFQRLPVHSRAEVLAGLAQAEQRLGSDPAAALQRLMAEAPGSVYAKRAQRWLDEPAFREKAPLVCQSCHDASRLAPTLERLKKKK